MQNDLSFSLSVGKLVYIVMEQQQPVFSDLFAYVILIYYLL